MTIQRVINNLRDEAERAVNRGDTNTYYSYMVFTIEEREREFTALEAKYDRLAALCEEMSEALQGSVLFVAGEVRRLREKNDVSALHLTNKLADMKDTLEKYRKWKEDSNA